MLVRTCKSNSVAQIIVFIITALALILPDVFRSPIRFEATGGVLDNILFQFYQSSPRLSVGAGFIFCLILIFGMSAQLNRHGLTKNPFAMPIFSLLIPALIPGLVALSPMHLVALCMVMACGCLFRMYDRREAYVQVFNAALYLSLIPLLAPMWIWMCLILPLCFLIYPVYHWREWVIGIGTMALVLGIAGITRYVVHQQPLYVYPEVLPLSQDWPNLLPQLLWVLGLVFAWVFVLRKGLELDIAQRKKVTLVAYILCVTAIPLLFFREDNPSILLIVAAFFFSEYIFRHPIKWMREFLFYLFVILLFFYRYGQDYLMSHIDIFKIF